MESMWDYKSGNAWKVLAGSRLYNSDSYCGVGWKARNIYGL